MERDSLSAWLTKRVELTGRIVRYENKAGTEEFALEVESARQLDEER